MPSAGFEPTIPASERRQTHSLERAASWIGIEDKEIKRLIGRDRLTGVAVNLEVILSNNQELNFYHEDNATCLPSE
jgi:hypothetical protein